MRDLHGLIFAYDANPRLRELTEHRAVSSIPYGGRYRVIDFMLSSMVNCDINDIGVIMRENYQSLIDHLGGGKDWDLSRKRGGLRLLPPFGFAGVRGGDFRGKMEALRNVEDYIRRIRQNYVVLASGDILVNLPLDLIFEQHLKSGRDMTAVVTRRPAGIKEFETFLGVRPDGRVNRVSIGKPDITAYEAMGVYIISRTLLESLVSNCAAHNLYDFERDVLQAMCDRLNIGLFAFDGYVGKLSDTAEYFRHSMDLLKPETRRQLFVTPVKTKVRDEPSAYYGPESDVTNSLIADGCYIEGHVENSVIARGVKIGKGAYVSNSIVMQDTSIGDGATLNFVITDKQVTIGPGRVMMGHENYPVAISKGMKV